jgi:hypothetical protein
LFREEGVEKGVIEGIVARCERIKLVKNYLERQDVRNRTGQL